MFACLAPHPLNHSNATQTTPTTTTNNQPLTKPSGSNLTLLATNVSGGRIAGEGGALHVNGIEASVRLRGCRLVNNT